MGNCQNIQNYTNRDQQLIIKIQDEKIVQLQQSQGEYPVIMQKCLKVVTKTWSKNSHMLFDYEDQSKTTNVLVISQEGYIIRIDNNVFFLSNAHFQQRKQEDIEVLMEVYQQSDIFRMRKENEFYKSKYPHIVARSVEQCSPQSCLSLMTEDIIKVGKIQFRVAQLNTQQKKIQEDTLFCSENNPNSQKTMPQMISENEYDDEAIDDEFPGFVRQISLNQSVCTKIENNMGMGNSTIQVEEKISTQQPLCRICLGDSQSQRNPFIEPCKCTGSMKSIHLQCLRHWFKLKQETRKTEFCESIRVQNYQCEICKQQYPRLVPSNGRSYNLIDDQELEPPYAILESVNTNNQTPDAYLEVHTLLLNRDQKFTVGRGYECDLRISDISVSRQHSEIIFIQADQRLLLYDTNSKFGTLLIPTQDIDLQQEIQVQCGRSFLSFATFERPYKVNNSAENQIFLGDDEIEDVSELEVQNQNQEDNESDQYSELILSSARMRRQNNALE